MKYEIINAKIKVDSEMYYVRKLLVTQVDFYYRASDCYDKIENTC